MFHACFQPKLFSFIWELGFRMPRWVFECLQECSDVCVSNLEEWVIHCHDCKRSKVRPTLCRLWEANNLRGRWWWPQLVARFWSFQCHFFTGFFVILRLGLGGKFWKCCLLSLGCIFHMSLRCFGYWCLRCMEVDKNPECCDLWSGIKL